MHGQSRKLDAVFLKSTRDGQVDLRLDSNTILEDQNVIMDPQGERVIIEMVEFRPDVTNFRMPFEDFLNERQGLGDFFHVVRQR